MSEQTPPLSPSAPAPGYATVQYDSMTGWVVVAGGVVLPTRFTTDTQAQVVAYALEKSHSEELRWKDEAKYLRKALEVVAHAIRVGAGPSSCGNVVTAALNGTADESHNEVAERRAQKGENHE